MSRFEPRTDKEMNRSCVLVTDITRENEPVREGGPLGPVFVVICCFVLVVIAYIAYAFIRQLEIHNETYYNPEPSKEAKRRTIRPRAVSNMKENMSFPENKLSSLSSSSRKSTFNTSTIRKSSTVNTATESQSTFDTSTVNTATESQTTFNTSSINLILTTAQNTITAYKDYTYNDSFKDYYYTTTLQTLKKHTSINNLRKRIIVGTKQQNTSQQSNATKIYNTKYFKRQQPNRIK